MRELPLSHGWRFSLRSLLIATAVVALAAVNWKVLFYLGVIAQTDFIFWMSFIGVTAIGWNLGQSGPKSLSVSSRPVRLLALIWLTLFAAGLCYLLWARERWQEIVRFRPMFPIPYPDSWLMQLHEWFDRRYPTPPGVFKLHGEIASVYIVVNYAAWLTAAVLAFTIGLFFRVNRSVIVRRVGELIRQVTQRT